MDFSGIQDIDLQVLHLLNGSNHLLLDQLVQLLTSGFTWIPLYIMLFIIVIRNNETMGQIVLVVAGALFCVLLADGLADGVIKPLTERVRPVNDPMVRDTLTVLPGMNLKSFSFCSAHAANTMAIAVFFGLLVRSKLLSWTLILWSLVNCWTRLYLGVHYPSDILCGLLLGVVVGVLVYLLYLKMYRRISPKITYISNQYTSSGYDHDDIDMVMVVLMFIMVYVLIRGVVMTSYV